MLVVRVQVRPCEFLSRLHTTCVTRASRPQHIKELCWARSGTLDPAPPRLDPARPTRHVCPWFVSGVLTDLLAGKVPSEGGWPGSAS